MSEKMTRRAFTVSAGVGVVVVKQRTALSAPRAVTDEIRVISSLPHRYHGWPTLGRRRNGALLVVCSGGREKHVCPFGRVDLIRSQDQGQTWSWPEVVMDGPIDDRDAGVLETAHGTLLVTSFTSLAYESVLDKAQAEGSFSAEKLRRWQAAHSRVDAPHRQAALGVWMKRSTDGGVTWSQRYDCRVNSPHGPIQLSDGRLLYAGKDLYRPPHRVGVCESMDDGRSWRWLADLPTRVGDDHREYHELHAVEAANGQLVLQLRNHNSANERETLQSTSQDGGRTWSTPRSIGVWGLPSHLLRLSDDRLLMSYGHRRGPLGNQARVSHNHGQSWSDPLILSSDGSSGDLGYASTTQLDDGSFLTVWYERFQNSPFAQLRQARWRLS